MFGHLTLSLDKKYASKQEIHGEQKFREISIVLLPYGTGAQFQQHENPASRVISCDRGGLGGKFTLSGVNLACAQKKKRPTLYH